ncbi:MAG TPA: hypothetical protein VG713_08755 [Pirellulales bacterium]|nr:hypothetical protein [Pirellulales bacterium]
MALNYFTLVHVLISLVGIAAGFGVLAGLIAGRLLSRWTTVFLAFTAATSVTGFFFPFNGITPGIVIGVISMFTLAITSYALYARQLAGPWRTGFVVNAVLSQYFNCFVLIAQLFQKMPALAEIAPNQSGPAFALTQASMLIAFIVLGWTALRRFAASPALPSDVKSVEVIVAVAETSSELS